MRVFVQDFSGHPFQIQLSRELAARGHDVLHTYCPDYLSGQGDLSPDGDDPRSLRIEPITLGKPFNKYQPLRRLLQEIRYGRMLARRVRAESPDVVLSCNEPLLSKLVLGASCRVRRRPWVFWLQDLYSVAMQRELVARSGRLGTVLGGLLIRVEGWLLESSAAVVLISPAFADWIEERNIRPQRTEVIPNWAPLDEIPYHAELQQWFDRRLDLGKAPVALYAGTLGRKHNAEALVEVASMVADLGAHVVVISEGVAADALSTHRDRVDNLHVLPFQPWEELPEILGSASCLLVILDEAAGAFSVPSKVLTYLCAGRAIVASVPKANLAALTLVESGAGVVVPPEDLHGFALSVKQTLADPVRAAAMGRSARAHAVDAFDLTTIADRFEALLEQVAQQNPSRGAVR